MTDEPPAMLRSPLRPFGKATDVGYRASVTEAGPETDGHRCHHCEHQRRWPDCEHEYADVLKRVGRLFAIRDQLCVPDDQTVRAALAPLPKEERVPPVGPVGISDLSTPRDLWRAEDYAAYHGALVRCLRAAHHDPDAIVAAGETSLRHYRAKEGMPDPGPAEYAPRLNFQLFVMAVDWAWERAIEEARLQHPVKLAPPRAQQLESFLLKFRLQVERMRLAARRVGQTRAQFREALGNLESFETRGRPQGSGYPAVALLLFIEELAGCPELQQPLDDMLDREVIQSVERAVTPLVASWQRFFPRFCLQVPEDIILDTEPEFPALTNTTIADALRPLAREMADRDRIRAAPVRIAETIGARLFNASVRMAEDRVSPEVRARWTLARRAWRGQ